MNDTIGRDGAPHAQLGYYGKNIVKPHVWKPHFIGTYFFLGGLAGTAATLALGARWRRNHELARAGLVCAAGGAAMSSVLLIADLGRPERFINMLRVVKVTSPMNVGTWILSAFGASVTLAAACDLMGRRTSGVAKCAEFIAGLMGLPLSVYTAVLVSDTATPVWFEGREFLPFLFAAGAASSAGAATSFFVSGNSGRAARRLAFFGSAFELAIHHRMIEELGPLGEAYRTGRPHALSSLGMFCNGVGALLSQAPGVPPLFRRAGAVLTMAGALCERLAVLEAGRVSALDPKYVLEQQRPG